MDFPAISVLILSYNALPMDVVSSYRAKAYCDHFLSFGIRPTLLTHRWEFLDKKFVLHHSDDKVVIEETESCKIIRLPYPGAIKSTSSLQTTFSYMKGDLDVELMLSYNVFKKFLWDHLKEHHYDFVIAIYNPHFHLKLAYEIGKKFKIPYVLDFRDLWENDIMTTSYKPGLKKRILDRIIAGWWRKWIHSSVLFSTVSERWQGYLSELSGRRGILVRNGFDDFSVKSDIPRRHRTYPFKVVHFGRMYPGQNLDVFLDGFKSFAADYSAGAVIFEVIGLKKISGIDFESKIKAALGPYVTFRPYVPREELLRYCRDEATLFFFPDFADDNGSFAVKVYDYLMLGKNILVAPGGGEVSRLVRELNAGVVINDPSELRTYLSRCVEEFGRNGYVGCRLDKQKLNGYSRKSQVKVMADHLIHFASRR